MEYARVRGGVVRPLPHAQTASGEHLLVLNRNSDHRQYGRSPSYLPESYTCQTPKCEPRHTNLLFLRQSQTLSTKVAILDLRSCAHITCLEMTKEQIGSTYETPLGGELDEPVTTLKRILSEASREGTFDHVCEQFNSWLQADLEIHLNETIRQPYHNALTWRPGLGSLDLHQVLHPLLETRANLLDVYALARARGVDSLMLDSVQLASQRLETALLSLTAWQTVILEQAAQDLAETAARSEREDRAHDRRIADLGAITLFPLLLFSLLGANILPSVKFPFELNGPLVLVVSLLAAASVATAGRRWIRRQHSVEAVGARRKRLQ